MAAQDYIDAFTDDDDHTSTSDFTGIPFLIHYIKGHDGALKSIPFSRIHFWKRAQKAAAILHKKGCKRGCHVAHYFSGNEPSDLIFRVGATLIGAIPVTINWQADNFERILYKLSITNSKVVLFDASTSKKMLEKLGQVAKCYYINASSALDESTNNDLLVPPFCLNIPITHPRIVIFTSGTTGNPKGVKLTYKNYRTNRRTFEQFLQVSSTKVCVNKTQPKGRKKNSLFA